MFDLGGTHFADDQEARMAHVGDVIDAYDDKYADGCFRNNDTYYRCPLDFLSPKAGETLLDIACGLGDLLYYAGERHLDCYGIDLSSVATRAAKKRAPLAKTLVANTEMLPFAEGVFDNITLIGSLEHLLDPGKGLLEMRRVLKWGGQALILVPNGFYLPDIIWQVWRTGYGPNHKQIVQRFASAQEWRGFIESGGLKVRWIKRSNFQWPRSRRDWAWYKANPKRLLGLIAAPFIPFNLSNSFLYLCEKDPATRGQVYDPLFWPAPPRLVDLK